MPEQNSVEFPRDPLALFHGFNSPACGNSGSNAKIFALSENSLMFDDLGCSADLDSARFPGIYRFQVVYYKRDFCVSGFDVLVPSSSEEYCLIVTSNIEILSIVLKRNGRNLGCTLCRGSRDSCKTLSLKILSFQIREQYLTKGN